MAIHRLTQRLSGSLLAAVLAAQNGPAFSGLHASSDIHVVIGGNLVSALAGDGRVPVMVRELSVDVDGMRRRVVPGKCEDVGELELSRLAQTTEVEEAFAFIPDRCTWIDIGVAQTPSSVRVERGVIDGLVAAFGRVVVYHIHPQAMDGSIRYLPAYADLLAVVLINSRYLEDQDVEILHRAVTPFEIFEYSFRPSGDREQMRQAIFSTGLAPFAGENLLLSYAGSERESEYYEAIHGCPAIAEGVGSQIGSCFPMAAGDFILLHRERPESAGPTLAGQ